jgi:hypothetical protein
LCVDWGSKWWCVTPCLRFVVCCAASGALTTAGHNCVLVRGYPCTTSRLPQETPSAERAPEPRTSHGHTHAMISPLYYTMHHSCITRYILHTQYAPHLAEVLGVRQPLPKSSRISPCSKGARFKGICNKSLLTKIPFQRIPKPSPIANYYSTPSRDEW